MRKFFQAKPPYFFSNTLFSPDTYFATDFRLSVNATGLLCNSILPVVTLCIVVLYSIFICSCKVVVITYEHIKKNLRIPCIS